MRNGQPKSGAIRRTKCVVPALVAGIVFSLTGPALADENESCHQHEKKSCHGSEGKSCHGGEAKSGHGKDFNGRAHWYGAELHGHPTASGELFDKEKFTAAHPSIPLGTHVHVRSVHTGREVIVKINDRCPVTSQRVIDLSEAAARHIGIWPHHKSDVQCTVVGRHVPEHLKHLQHPSVQATHAIVHGDEHKGAHCDEHKVAHGDDHKGEHSDEHKVAHSDDHKVDGVSPAVAPRTAQLQTAHHEKLRLVAPVADSGSMPSVAASTDEITRPRPGTTVGASVPVPAKPDRDITAMKLPLSGSIEMVPVPAVHRPSAVPPRTVVTQKQSATPRNDGEWTIAPIAGLQPGL